MTVGVDVGAHSVFHCLWVWKGGSDGSQAVYRLGRGPWREEESIGFGVSQSRLLERT